MTASKELLGSPTVISIRGSDRAWLCGRKVAGEALGVVEVALIGDGAREDVQEGACD